MSDYNNISDPTNAIAQYGLTVEYTQNIRKELVSKMLPAITDMDIKAEMADPELYEAKAKMISTVTSLLNDLDNSKKNFANTKLKQKDSEVNANTSIDISKILQGFKLNQNPVFNDTPEIDMDALDDEIEKEFTSSDLEIPDFELEDNTKVLSRGLE